MLEILVFLWIFLKVGGYIFKFLSYIFWTKGKYNYEFILDNNLYTLNDFEKYATGRRENDDYNYHSCNIST